MGREREKERAYDRYLVAAAQLGDGRALERLGARWHPKLFSHAWRLLGDGELARDVTQEAWLEILRGLARLEDAAAFPAWALRIVTRRVARTIGRRQRHRATIEALAREPLPEPAPAPGERSAEFAAVQRAMETLPPEQRAALALHYLEDLSVAEIAVALQVPAGTVKTRLMHARRKVRLLVRHLVNGDDDEEHR